MAKFCTSCGTRNDNAAQFCEECGKPLRAAALPIAQDQAQPAPGPDMGHGAAPGRAAAGPTLGRWLLPAVLAAAVLVVAIAGIAWWASPPAASADAFASALRGPSGAAATPSADLLCLANLPYDHPQINVQQYDSDTRSWMDSLVSAGLYTPGQPVNSLFRPLIQYTPTPELGTWRRGTRLCAAKSWSVSEVKGGSFSPDKRGPHTLYRASVVWKAESVAPWLAQVTAGPWSPGVRLDSGALTTESTQVFEIRDRRWVALTAADQVRIQREALQAGRRGVTAKGTTPAQGGMFSALTNLFSGWGTAHPLVGEWAVDNTSSLGGFLGAALPFKGGHVTFGSDYMESGGERVKARFEVNGDVVNVRAEGETGGIEFRVKDKNTMVMAFGLAEIPFNRVR
jgi:hypothetical protein